MSDTDDSLHKVTAADNDFALTPKRKYKEGLMRTAKSQPPEYIALIFVHCSSLSLLNLFLTFCL